VLPSYLEAIVADENNDDLGEFLAYHCAGDCNERESLERDERLGILTAKQIYCLVDVLRYVREELGDVYFSELELPPKR
jgi:hypothetical protein